MAGWWSTTGLKDLHLTGESFCTSRKFAQNQLNIRTGAQHATQLILDTLHLHIADEQLAARDLSVADPLIKKRFGRGTQYNLKVRDALTQLFLGRFIHLVYAAPRMRTRDCRITSA